MAFALRTMTVADHTAILELWRQTEGICIRAVDSVDATQRYLVRNPGMSFVAVEEGAIIGTIQSGHDGRRGYIQHLAVASSHRMQGVGRRLVNAALQALSRAGIAKSHLFVLKENRSAQSFWSKLGWELREDVHLFSLNRSSDTNA